MARIVNDNVIIFYYKVFECVCKASRLLSYKVN